MRHLSTRALTGLVTAAVLALTPASALATATAHSVTVTGSVHHPGQLTVAELNAMPQHSKEVAFGIGAARNNHTFKGALLYDVLNGAGPAVDPKVRNDLQRFVITVVGAGGHAAALAWGEIDPELENKTVLLATLQDGKPLAAPELVVPFDTEAGRYITDVVRVHLSRPELRAAKPHDKAHRAHKALRKKVAGRGGDTYREAESY